jgi:hypothetical protein
MDHFGGMGLSRPFHLLVFTSALLSSNASPGQQSRWCATSQYLEAAFDVLHGTMSEVQHSPEISASKMRCRSYIGGAPYLATLHVLWV